MPDPVTFDHWLLIISGRRKTIVMHIYCTFVEDCWAPHVQHLCDKRAVEWQVVAEVAGLLLHAVSLASSERSDF